MVEIEMSPSRSRSACQRAWSAGDSAASRRRSWTIRSRISAAAFRVKVMARMFVGSTPALSRLR